MGDAVTGAGYSCSMRAKHALIIFLVVTFAGLLSFSVAETSWMAEGNMRSAKYPLVWELSGAYTFLLLLPLLILVSRRYPIERTNLATRLPLHAGFFVVFAISHTLLMWGSREL